MSKKKHIKHSHGMPNPILMQEEEAMIAQVDKAVASSSNAQIIGRNGEVPLREFFNRYLPYTLRAATGHFVPPSGELSPQIDLMILDSRYPLLSQNSDNSVLAMMHSVVITIEVKTNLTTGNVKKIWSDCSEVMRLADELPNYGGFQWGAIATWAFAYRTRNRLLTLDDRYIESSKPWKTGLDLFVMRLKDSDQLAEKKLGALFHYEPIFETDSPIDVKIVDWTPTCSLKQTPLSDLYYSVVQHSYYTLAARNHQFNDIGRHVMDYLSWTSFSWDKFYDELDESSK